MSAVSRRAILIGGASMTGTLLGPARGWARAAGLPTRKLYVANTNGDSITVLTGAPVPTGRVYHFIPPHLDEFGKGQVPDLEHPVEIHVGAHPHGLAAPSWSGRLYCSVESDNSVKVIDTGDDRGYSAAIATSGRPNQLAITPDERWLYVAINDHGTADVIDLGQRRVVKTLTIGPSPHNCYCPRRGRFMYVSSIGDHSVRQFDYRNDHKLLQTVRFDGPVRPICVTDDDKRLFVAIEGLHGFAWADLTTGRQVARVERPLPPADQRSKFAYMNTHGLELRPGGKELWVTSFIGNALMVFDVRVREPRYLTSVPVGDAPNWLAFSADGKYAYSANAGSNSVSVVDCDARKTIQEVKVGAVPKRLVEVWINPPSSF